jgi:hypothetical protein
VWFPVSFMFGNIIHGTNAFIFVRLVRGNCHVHRHEPCWLNIPLFSRYAWHEYVCVVSTFIIMNRSAEHAKERSRLDASITPPSAQQTCVPFSGL